MTCSSGVQRCAAAADIARSSSGEPSQRSSANGWSWRFSPTGRSATTSMPSARRSPAGPIPERSRTAGEQ